MAQSSFGSRQFSSEQFVESCGAVLFDLANPQIPMVCLVNLLKKDEWMLAKGRRNIGESRKDAALREIIEETGYVCHLLPVRMVTRATALDAPADVSDKPRIHDDVTEPFTCTFRNLPHGKGVKIIWWYVAVLNDDAHARKGPGEKTFRPEFFACSEAIEKLTFESDREVVKTATQIVEETLHVKQRSA